MSLSRYYRAGPKDPNPTWLGYSVGRWDGDALVVDTAGFNGKAWLDEIGHPDGGSAHYRAPPQARFRGPRSPTHHQRSECLSEAMDGELGEANACRYGSSRVRLQRKRKGREALAPK